MENLPRVPARLPTTSNQTLEQRVSAILLKHKALMDGLAKYDSSDD